MRLNLGCGNRILPNSVNYDVTTFDIFDPTTRYGNYYKFYSPYKWSIVRQAELNKGKSSIFCDLEAIK